MDRPSPDELQRLLLENRTLRLQVQSLAQDAARGREAMETAQREKQAVLSQIRAIAELCFPQELSAARRTGKEPKTVEAFLVWLTEKMVSRRAAEMAATQQTTTQCREAAVEVAAAVTEEIQRYQEEIQRLSRELQSLREEIAVLKGSGGKMPASSSSSAMLDAKKREEEEKQAYLAVVSAPASGSTLSSPNRDAGEIFQGNKVAEIARLLEMAEGEAETVKEDVAAVLQCLAGEIRKQAVAQRLGWHSSRFAKVIGLLLEKNCLEEIPVTLGQGRPSILLRLLPQGMKLSVLVGGEANCLYDEFLRRHRSPEQVLLVLRTAEILRSWGYAVELMPQSIAVPQGTCFPDLVVQKNGETLLVEVELHPFGSIGSGERLPYHKDIGRLRKWDIFYAAGRGTIAAFTTTTRLEDALRRELTLWYTYSPLIRSLRSERREPVLRLLLANCRNPGNGWTVHTIR